MPNLTPLQLAQEAYINIFKSEYGIKPRIFDESSWNDLEWLEQQIKFMCTERSEPEPKPELGYFEELMSNIKDSDYE